MSTRFSFFKETYKFIAIDLRKQEALDVDPKAIQEIDFAGNLDLAGNTTMFFVLEEVKETIIKEWIKVKEKEK